MSVIGMTPMTCRMCRSILRDKGKKYFSKTARCGLFFLVLLVQSAKIQQIERNQACLFC